MVNGFKYHDAIWKNRLKKFETDKWDTQRKMRYIEKLIQSQMAEFHKARLVNFVANGDELALAKELADIISSAQSGLVLLGYDPEAFYIYRLMSRHKGKARKICEKYELPSGDLR